MEEESPVTRLKSLISKKEKIEEEIKAFQEILESNNVGMNDELIDKEGFPRTDIDVYSIRTARSKIICLKNDLNHMMKEIEDGLHKVHAMARESSPKKSEEKMEVSQGTEIHPFLVVDLISRDSPAEKAGLKLGDEILQFGTITSNNFCGLPSVGDLVQHSQGKPLSITIKREGCLKNLVLTPNKWSGRGLLGCNVVPTK